MHSNILACMIVKNLFLHFWPRKTTYTFPRNHNFICPHNLLTPRSWPTNPILRSHLILLTKHIHILSSIIQIHIENSSSWVIYRRWFCYSYHSVHWDWHDTISGQMSYLSALLAYKFWLLTLTLINIVFFLITLTALHIYPSTISICFLSKFYLPPMEDLLVSTDSYFVGGYLAQFHVFC